MPPSDGFGFPSKDMSSASTPLDLNHSPSSAKAEWWEGLAGFLTYPRVLFLYACTVWPIWSCGAKLTSRSVILLWQLFRKICSYFNSLSPWEWDMWSFNSCLSALSGIKNGGRKWNGYIIKRLLSQCVVKRGRDVWVTRTGDVKQNNNSWRLWQWCSLPSAGHWQTRGD